MSSDLAIFKPIVDAVVNLLIFLSSGILKQNAGDLMHVESVDDDQTVVLKDGSRLTVLEIEGSLRMVGAEEFKEICDQITTSLRAYLGRDGHAFHIYFVSDPDSAERTIRTAQARSRETAQRLGLDLEDLFDEDVKHLSKYVSNEKLFLSLITRPAAVSKEELVRDQKAKVELLTSHPVPRVNDAPNLFAAIRALRTRHSAFVAGMMTHLGNLKIAARVLQVHDAIREMRASYDPDFTADEWRPKVLGDAVPYRELGRDGVDMAGALPPRLERQIACRDAIVRDRRRVEVGDRMYAPMSIRMFPKQVSTFYTLFGSLKDTRMPWRMTFLIEAGGIKDLDFKDMAATLLAFSSSENKLYNQASEQVRALVRNGNTSAVRVRVDIATWAPRDEQRLLDTRASRLARAVQGWGSGDLDVQELAGDAYQGFLSSCLALTLKSVAPPTCADIKDIVTMLPLTRPASPWADGGAVLYRSPDGKLWPYQPNSPVQSSWIAVMVAEPRSGKSVNGNQINLGLCLSPGITRLPMIAIIDVGKASSGLISLLEYALPESQRHLAVSIRYRMTPEFATNPFDTQLGCRNPLPHEEAFLVNFMSLLVTPIGKAAPADGMVGLVRMAIHEAYRYYSDEKDPKRYSRNVEGAEKIDRAIEQYGLHIDEKTTWWEIVDALFSKGATHEAMLAQRYAVPLVPDIAAISREPQFLDMYGKNQTESGEPLLAAFARMLSEAVRNYPILSKPTKFDLGDARVVSIDLDEVAKSGSAAADHQTAVCYMLARYVAARNFYLLEDHVPSFPEQYRGYHEKRIHDIRQDKKHLHYDEYHRTKKLAAVREQVLMDCREGGKWGVMVTLISQSVTDYDDAILEFATCKFVISKQNEKNAGIMRQMFNLTDTSEFAVKNLIRPPGPDGATFVAVFATKRGDSAHVLNNTIGGLKLWAFSTSNEDTYVRDRLYKTIGPAEARKLLSTLYPGGSIADELERRKKKRFESGMMETQNEDGVINELIRDILNHYEGRIGEEAA